MRIPVQSCFRRSVELPTAARGDAGRILELDLERSTPFKLKDVYTAAYIDEGAGAGGRIKAVQLVAKRQAIDPILEELRAADLKVDFVDCWDEQGSAALPVNFLAAAGPQRTDFGRLVTAPRLLAAFAALLVVAVPAAHAVALPVRPGGRAGAGGGDAHAGHGRAHRAGDLERGGRRADAAAAPEARADPEHCHHRRADPLLPDSVWIADLRLEGSALDITGLAKSGASLLPLFERSKMFAEPTLTAPLTFDQQEDKERFSLRVRLRQPGGEERSATNATGTEEQH